MLYKLNCADYRYAVCVEDIQIIKTVMDADYGSIKEEDRSYTLRLFIRGREECLSVHYGFGPVARKNLEADFEQLYTLTLPSKQISYLGKPRIL